MRLFCKLCSAKYVAGVLLALSLCANYVCGNVSSIVNSEPVEALKYLLARFESGQEQFSSGKVKVSWEMTGLISNYFEIPAGTQKQMSVDVAFSGDKLRWDTYTKHIDANDRVAAYVFRGVLNNPVEYQTRKYVDPTIIDIEDAHEVEPTELYVRKFGQSKSSVYSGGRVDLKFLMEPYGAPLASLRQLLSAGEEAEVHMQVLDVSSDSDNLITVKMKMSSESSSVEKHITFDVSKGYNIVKEAAFIEGRRVSGVVRTLRRYGDGWFLDSLEHTDWRHSIGTEPTSKAVIKVHEFEPNVTIPEETFEIRGMGLAKHAEVHDMVVGVKFKPNVDGLLEESMENLLAKVESGTSDNTSKSEPEKQKVVPEIPPELPPAGQERQGQKEPVEDQNGPELRLIISLAVVVAAALILILLRKRLSRKR